jgi:NAD(P)-dependent dehydrogenase (short-subunit alcohol dehydrogenase family)
MRRQFEVNVFGAVSVAKAFLPRFRSRRRGFIINVTSMGGNDHHARNRLLLRQQIRASRHIRGHAFRNGAFRRLRDGALPRIFPDGMSGTIDGSN